METVDVIVEVKDGERLACDVDKVRTDEEIASGAVKDADELEKDVSTVEEGNDSLDD